QYSGTGAARQAGHLRAAHGEFSRYRTPVSGCKCSAPDPVLGSARRRGLGTSFELTKGTRDRTERAGCGRAQYGRDGPRAAGARTDWGKSLSRCFRLIVQARAKLYESGILPSRRLTHPVISIGNVTVGGTGKTPLVMAIAEGLRERGFRPVVLSRGYG